MEKGHSRENVYNKTDDRQDSSKTVCILRLKLDVSSNLPSDSLCQYESGVRWLGIQGAAEKSSPLKFFAVFSATV